MRFFLDISYFSPSNILDNTTTLGRIEYMQWAEKVEWQGSGTDEW